MAGAATKGLQAPGIRIGWVVAAKKYIEVLGNFSSFGMGGVSQPSQLYALKLFDKKRIELARDSISRFYDEQRKKYEPQLEEYAALMRGFGEKNIKLGLYFPLSKGWREWEYRK